MRAIRGIDRILGICSAALLVTLLAVMLLMGFTQVVLRNFFSASILWGDVFLRHVVLWVAFLGAIVAAGERRHITIDALTKILSGRWQKIAAIVTGIASVVVCYFLTEASYRFMLDEMEYGGTLLLGIPRWVFVSIIPIGFGMIMLRFGINVLEDGVDLIEGTYNTGERLPVITDPKREDEPDA
jgi:TRAP-type C4-dicarboxylate transport system permease small subunit